MVSYPIPSLQYSIQMTIRTLRTGSEVFGKRNPVLGILIMLSGLSPLPHSRFTPVLLLPSLHSLYCHPTPSSIPLSLTSFSFVLLSHPPPLLISPPPLISERQYRLVVKNKDSGARQPGFKF